MAEERGPQWAHSPKSETELGALPAGAPPLTKSAPVRNLRIWVADSISPSLLPHWRYPFCCDQHWTGSRWQVGGHGGKRVIQLLP